MDATLGEGGHSAAILNATVPGGRLLGIDRDPRMLTVADRRLADFTPRFTSVHAGYDGLTDAAASRGIRTADGVLMDLGISSRQLEAPGYTFSFQPDAPTENAAPSPRAGRRGRRESGPQLDMRFDPSSPLTAHQVVNTYTEEELTSLLRENGEEPRARQIARAIVRHRPIGDAATLAEVVTAAVGGRGRRRLHPATRTFQALRITVNNELDVLREGLQSAVRLLAAEREAGGHQLSQPGRPHRKAIPGPGGCNLCLPSGDSSLCVRTSADGADSQSKGDQTVAQGSKCQSQEPQRQDAGSRAAMTQTTNH